VIARSLLDALRPYKAVWQKRLTEEGKIGRRDLQEWRAAEQADSTSTKKR
jgi:hypothetical protein